MKKAKAIRLSAIAMVGALATCQVSESEPLASSAKEQTPKGIQKALDAIPQALLKKMFIRQGLVGSPGLTWEKQRVITVAFNGGNDELYALIESTAKEWTSNGGQLSFSFKSKSGRYNHWGPDDKLPQADIRIGFDNSGYWSLIGKLAKNVDPGDATMNFEGFPQSLAAYASGHDLDTWRVSYEHTTILHEFGHALGLSHEHFNPACQSDLKMDAIVAYLMGPPNNWSKEQAQFNIDAKFYARQLAQRAGPLETKLLTSRTTDQASVMLYLFPDSFYESGSRSVCKPAGDHDQSWVTTLSDGDKKFFLNSYGKIAPPL
jgi:hypothetical protein